MSGFSGSGLQMKKGFLRLFILTILYREPLHGYGIMKRISERSGDFWVPRTGNIYPLIQVMVGEGLIKHVGPTGSRRKLYAITEKGRTELLHLFREAQELINNLIMSLKKNEGEWVRIQIQLLEDLSLSDRNERIESIQTLVDTLVELLTRVQQWLEKGKQGNNETPSNAD